MLTAGYPVKTYSKRVKRMNAELIDCETVRRAKKNADFSFVKTPSDLSETPICFLLPLLTLVSAKFGPNPSLWTVKQRSELRHTVYCIFSIQSSCRRVMT
jgi:hypothetical protein